MLILARREKQKVLFPDLGISIEVLRINSNGVKIGIDAPSDVSILRNELHEANQQARYEKKTPGELSHRKTTDDSLNMASLRTSMQLLAFLSSKGNAEGLESTLSRASTALQAIEEVLAKRGDAVRSSQPSRILLILNDQENQVTLAECLRCCGLSVEVVRDAAEGMVFLEKEFIPDVILIDAIGGNWKTLTPEELHAEVVSLV